MTSRLDGRVAIVTGGANGIGLAIARRFAAEGARVTIADINAERAEAEAQALVEAGHEVRAFAGDMGVTADIDALFDGVSETHGAVSILVNNAGIMSPQHHFFDGDEAWWDTFLRTNLTSHYLCTDRAARIMARNGGGAVVNMSSGGATRAHRGMVAYDAAKGGIEGFTRAAALELAPYGIRVNALVPGLIATNPDESAASRQRRDETIPMGRGGTGDDIAGPALFLVGDDAAYVTGATLVVDGGVLVQQRSPQVETFSPGDYPAVSDI